MHTQRLLNEFSFSLSLWQWYKSFLGTHLYRMFGWVCMCVQCAYACVFIFNLLLLFFCSIGKTRKKQFSPCNDFQSQTHIYVLKSHSSNTDTLEIYLIENRFLDTRLPRSGSTRLMRSLTCGSNIYKTVEIYYPVYIEQ